MEILLIVGAIISLPIILYGIKTPKNLERPETPIEKRGQIEATDDISVSKFNAKIRQERVLDAMSLEEKRMFLHSSGYVSSKTDLTDDGFVKFVNVCMTIVLLILATLLIFYLTENKLPEFSFKIDL